MQTHHFYHNKPTPHEVGCVDATRLLIIAEHSKDPDKAQVLRNRVLKGLRQISRLREGDQEVAGYGEQWHGLFRFGDRSRAIKYVMMTRQQARDRNRTIRDLEMEWTVAEPIR